MSNLGQNLSKRSVSSFNLLILLLRKGLLFKYYNKRQTLKITVVSTASDLSNILYLRYMK